MFCGGFLQSKPAGMRAKTGLFGGLPYLVVWDEEGGILPGGRSSLFFGIRGLRHAHTIP